MTYSGSLSKLRAAISNAEASLRTAMTEAMGLDRFTDAGTILQLIAALRGINTESPYDLNAQEIGYIRAGAPIEAIKRLRNRVTGLGLKDAKDIVDRYREAHPGVENR